MGRISTLGDILSNFEIIFLQVLLALTVLLFCDFFFQFFQMLGYFHVLQTRGFVTVIMMTLVTKENYCDALYFIIYWLKTKDFIEWRSGQIIVPFRTEIFLLVCSACILEPNAWVPIREVYWH